MARKPAILPCKRCGMKLLWLNNGLEHRPLEARPVPVLSGDVGYFVVQLPTGRREWRRTPDVGPPPPEHLRVHRCTDRLNPRRLTTLGKAIDELAGGAA